jgi:Surp module
LIDHTAEYVAKFGSNFERMLLDKEAENPKFEFLKENNQFR